MGVQAPTSIDEALAMAREASELEQRARALTVAVADALPALRADENVSQAMLSVASSISQPYLSQIENGPRRSTAQVLKAVTALSGYHDAREDLARARTGGNQ